MPHIACRPLRALPAASLTAAHRRVIGESPPCTRARTHRQIDGSEASTRRSHLFLWPQKLGYADRLAKPRVLPACPL